MMGAKAESALFLSASRNRRSSCQEGSAMDQWKLKTIATIQEKSVRGV